MTLSKSALLASFIFTGVLAGCSSSDDGGGNTVTDTGGTVNDTATSDTGGGSDTAAGDTATALDAGTDGAGDLGTDSAGGFTVKVEDYLNWCTVAVNGGATSTATTQTVTVASGGTVALASDKASATFVWGYYKVLGETAKDTSKTKTLTITKDTVIQACCPFASAPTTDCPDPTP